MFFIAHRNESKKYGGLAIENFEPTFKLFLKRCDQADILVKDCNKASSITLSGHALHYYLDFLESKSLNLKELEHAVKERFISTERTHALL